MSDDNVTVLAQKFQQLRGRPGKYGGGEYDEEIDSPDGEKFRVMKASLRGAENAKVAAAVGLTERL